MSLRCDGQRPCKICRKRGVDCEYRSHTVSASSSDSPGFTPGQSPDAESPKDTEPSGSGGTVKKPADQNPFERSTTPDFDFSFRLAWVLGSEGIEIPAHTCMLLDCRQRFSFVGRSTTHSFMHHIRNTIEKRTGSSEFTADSNWSGFSEAPFPTPCRIQSFPPLSVTAVLVEIFFTNTRGFIEVVNPEAVRLTLHQLHNRPNQVQGPDRCILYLVLAIGLALDPNLQGGDPTHSQNPDLKNQLFAVAEGLAHPAHTFEGSHNHDGVLWPLQSLVLMSFYMLAVSRRNAAYDYCGRAVRIAYALGIHRGHESEINEFPANEELRVLRRNVWRSLFILDRFLAASLGRPLAISDNEYSESSLRLPIRQTSASRVPRRDILDTAVDACKMIGHILNNIYSYDKVAIEVSNQMVGYLEAHPDFQNDGLFAINNSAPTIAQIHVQLLGFYANILLCRPFFLLLFMELRVSDGIQTQIDRLSSRWGFHANLLLNFDPLAFHLLFEAALVLLSSTHADIYASGEHLSLVKDAISILRTWSGSSPFAEQFASKLDLFQHDVEHQEQVKAIKVASRKQSHRVKRGSTTACDPSQYRSPFYTAPNGSMVSPCDSRRESVVTYPMIKQENCGYSDSLGSGALFSTMDFNIPRSQSFTDFSQGSQPSDHGGDMDLDRMYSNGNSAV
ncbi:hypothetical protein F53441_571 [Fusarium austroafricanum]|uniref:Xylanolytic transcriptional activator regulatory domain-containing protein n=1 Tax=Fusarium austroafricanum TaxID=2364996 RepID=A0A8H4KVH8_9HYPO|nr:hypothetical protein F53441_571 [Fusarium austroafricanum]